MQKAQSRDSRAAPYAETGLSARLEQIVGRRFVLTNPHQIKRYASGYRYGKGEALAVVKPGSLHDLWQVAQVCIEADSIIIMQASNTGLTGGSTPDGAYDRDVVIISTLRLNRILLLDGGEEVVCFPGATLDALEKKLRLHGREPHSVIGSSCIGASVIGGVCNNSGGALVKRGPAYTQYALYGQVDTRGELVLINHLGINLGDEPAQILSSLDNATHDVLKGVTPVQHKSDYEYRVREIDEDTPARYNADPRNLFETSGCAGHLIVFAVRLPTFEEEVDPSVFYLGSNDPDKLGALRRQVLSTFQELPVSAEYMHIAAIKLAEIYGKDTMLALRCLGPGRLPLLFSLKSKFDRVVEKLGIGGEGASDRLLQSLGRLVPLSLPLKIRTFRDAFEHHLIVKCSRECAREMRAYLTDHFEGTESAWFECTPDEADKAHMLRFSIAGAAVRYRSVHRASVSDIVAIDVALRRNEQDWFDLLPKGDPAGTEIALFYGHFLCHVFHLDYVIASDQCPDHIEQAYLGRLKAAGCEYPAEHNVGHHYAATTHLAAFYQELDPMNALNPGVGQVSRQAGWEAEVVGNGMNASVA